ncbi:hypothetical protein A0J61_09733 [Choanephora cucurbitarum]|uniref:Uncharacterized protein n=1 Tax=Choanephora cucurbitarum TaxID=101091 RepID=A0A1C7MZF1_9FUNG|nr:hypothetical protein A0J61_09733 [Choanephora cucurbitarum]
MSFRQHAPIVFVDKNMPVYESLQALFKLPSIFLCLIGYLILQSKVCSPVMSSSKKQPHKG